MIPKSGNKNIDLVITLGIIALIVFVVYKLIAILKNPFTELNPDTELPSPEDTAVDYSKLTHPAAQFDIWANQIYDAIWGFIADKQTVRDIMYQINSDDDLKLLIKKYGSQGSIIQTDTGGLVTHLREVMPAEDIAGFNYHFEGWGMKLRI